MVQNTEEADKPRIRVAIIGGGCAGLAAAWELAQSPRFDVHVFEKSWRVGGKGASGRDSDGRILEHGLHVWLGFYHNAFQLMGKCYAEVREHGWGPANSDPERRLAHASIEDAFFAEPHIGVAVESRARHVEVWSGYMPPAKGLPWEPLDAESNPRSLIAYLARCFELIKTLMLSVIGEPSEDRPGGPRPDSRSGVDESIELNFEAGPLGSPDALLGRMAYLLRAGALITTAAVLQAITIFEKWLQQQNYSRQLPDTALKFLEAIVAQTRKQLRDLAAVDEELRFKCDVIDIVMTIAVGLLRERVPFKKNGLDTLNGIDYRKWLKNHGATNSALSSRFLTGIYDLVFAYEGGNAHAPKLAAGVALRGALLMFFTYRGAMFWRMRSGMGDAVFAPLYKVLFTGATATKDRKARSKVQFHFLHNLKAIEFKTHNEKPYVEKLTFETVSTNRVDNPGNAALDHFGCWPNGEHLLVKTLEAKKPRTVEWTLRENFDAVIVATGAVDFADLLADVPNVAPMTPPAWRATLKSLKTWTVATKAGQVWLKEDLEGLGWYRGSGMFSALQMSFATWADMSHTRPSELAWLKAKPRETNGAAARQSKAQKVAASTRRVKLAEEPSTTSAYQALGDTATGPVKQQSAATPDAVKSIAYFCSVVSDRDLDIARRAQPAGDSLNSTVQADLHKLLRTDIKPLWPRPFEKRNGSALDAVVKTYHQLNCKGSDRYSLSLPSTINLRISPLKRFVANLTVAGDWTACGLDAGCVEAAVSSGMLAAHAITGVTPPLHSIVGFDHP